MSTIDREIMLEQTLAHAIKYADKEGKRERRQSAEAVAKVKAVNALKYFNETIDWDAHNCVVGYETIYHYVAGEYFGAGLKPMAKAEAANEYVGVIKQGFRSLRETMLEQHNILVYMTPRTANGLKIEVITIDPDYVVDAITGATADDIATERDARQAQGQVRSAYRRQAKIRGPEIARHLIQGAITGALTAPVAPAIGVKD